METLFRFVNCATYPNVADLNFNLRNATLPSAVSSCVSFISCLFLTSFFWRYAQILPASAKLGNKFKKSATGDEKPSFNFGRLFILMTNSLSISSETESRSVPLGMYCCISLFGILCIPFLTRNKDGQRNILVFKRFAISKCSANSLPLSVVIDLILPMYGNSIRITI